MVQRIVTLDDIKWARWSGANEPEPAVMVNGIPSPLTRHELEKLLVDALNERQKYQKRKKNEKIQT